jgi:hypothetical protein
LGKIGNNVEDLDLKIEKKLGKINFIRQQTME